MKDLYTEIRTSAKGYVAENDVERFIEQIARVESSVRVYFFQVTPSKDKISLEFGGHVGNSVIDITIGEGLLDIIVVPLAQVTAIRFIDLSDSCTLHLFSSTLGDLKYTAVRNQSRAQLRKYWEHVQENFISRG